MMEADLVSLDPVIPEVDAHIATMWAIQNDRTRCTSVTDAARHAELALLQLQAALVDDMLKASRSTLPIWMTGDEGDGGMLALA